MPSQFGTIRGDAGYITAARGAKAGIISKWIIAPVRMKADGKPELQFKAQFSYKNETLMNLVANGTLKGRVIVQMRGKTGVVEDVDILAWQEWRWEGGILYLNDVLHSEGVKFRPL